MIPAAHFFIDHPTATLVVSILCEQVGLPVPSVPSLLLIGSLAGLKPASLAPSICAAVLTCLVGDCIWFQVGRWRTSRNRTILDASTRSILRLSRLAESVRRYQLLALLLARFLPGPNLAAAFAGSSRMPRMRFIVLDIIVSAMWAGGYIAAGHFYRNQLEVAVCAVSAWSSTYLLLLVSSVVAIFLGVRLGKNIPSSCRRSSTAATTEIRNSAIGAPYWSKTPLVLCAHANSESKTGLNVQASVSRTSRLLVENS
jgi:membrane protein DedA with SNARE-associated domain